MSHKREILFVCSGNICRSPMAEYMLKKRLGRRPDWIVRSAGVSACDGLGPSAGAVSVAARHGVDITGHRSRRLTRSTVDSASVIVVMARSHLQSVKLLSRRTAEKTFLLKSFGSDAGGDVEDPIGSPEEAYQTVWREIDDALPGLMAFMREMA